MFAISSLLFIHCESQRDVVSIGFVTKIKLISLQCCDLKDIKLAYRLNKAMENGDNWKFLSMDQLNIYW